MKVTREEVERQKAVLRTQANARRRYLEQAARRRAASQIAARELAAEAKAAAQPVQTVAGVLGARTLAEHWRNGRR